MTRIALLIALIMLAGCGTTGKDIKTDVSITISNNTGSITIAPDLATESGDNSATPNNSPKVDVPINVPVDVTNPIQKLESAIEAAAGAEIEAAADEIVGAPTGTPILENKPPSKVEPGEGLEYTMQYRPEHDRMFTWLEQTGSDFGGQVTLSVPECDYELVVEDPQNNFKADGLYFDGTHNREKESNGIRASFFAPQGCRGAKLIVRY